MSEICPGCGNAIGPDRACHVCLIATAVEHSDRASGSTSAGESLLPYVRIVNVISDGARARVYLGEWIPPGHGLVAVKRRHSPSSSNRCAADVARLLDLDHPHIATLFESAVDADNRPYTITEYVAGTPLPELCDAGAASVVLGIELLLQAAEALEYAHSRGVAHLNLKPANVLAVPGAGVKLLDFRAAMPLDVDAIPDLPAMATLVASVLDRAGDFRAWSASRLDVLTSIRRRTATVARDPYGSLRELSNDLARALAT